MLEGIKGIEEFDLALKKIEASREAL